MGKNDPMTKNGNYHIQQHIVIRRSQVERMEEEILTENKSRRTEKQKAQGTGRPEGPRTTHCVITDELVDSNACNANDS